MPIIQSGSVSPGHLAKWVSEGVQADAGPMPYSERVLGTLLNADFNISSDQSIAMPDNLQAFQLTRITATLASTSLTTAVGGIYPAADKGGTPLVAASQIYTQLTDDTLLLALTLSSYAQQHVFTRDLLEDWAMYFSLTTPQGDDATASIYVIGIELL